MTPMTEDKLDGRPGIPRTGRIGRLAKIIEKETDQNIALQVMHDVDQFESTSNYATKAAWLRKAVERLEELVGKETTRKIMENCGRQCCGQTYRKRAQHLMSESKSMEEFIENLNRNRIGGGRLKLKDENTITGGYDHCYCEQVKHTKELFSKTYCYCSAGWYKQLFESALGRSVDVEPVQTIIMGAESCEFIIHFKR